MFRLYHRTYTVLKLWFSDCFELLTCWESEKLVTSGLTSYIQDFWYLSNDCCHAERTNLRTFVRRGPDEIAARTGQDVTSEGPRRVPTTATTSQLSSFTLTHWPNPTLTYRSHVTTRTCATSTHFKFTRERECLLLLFLFFVFLLQLLLLLLLLLPLPLPLSLLLLLAASRH